MPRRKVDLVVAGSKEAVTLHAPQDSEDLGIIEDGGVAIRQGRIVEAASTQLLERKYKAREVVDVNGQTILPGFVDPHTHLVFSGSREEEFQLRVEGAGYLQVLKKGGGILETVNRTRQTSSEELFVTASRRLDTALALGTTTVEVKSGYGLRMYDELKILVTIRRLSRQHPCRIVPTFLGAHAVPLEHANSDEYAGVLVDKMLPEVRRRNLARFCDVFCEVGAFDVKQSLRILRAASRQGFEAKVHADEFSSSGGTRVANELRALSADHLVHAPQKELERMTRTGVTPVLLPGSSHSVLMCEHANAREILAMGLPVALGTDFSPSSWILGQLTVAALAARILRMKAAEIIRGITINAARALGLGRNVGSLSPGKVADLVILNVPGHKWVGYGYGEGMVDKVLIGGRRVVEAGKRVR